MEALPAIASAPLVIFPSDQHTRLFVVLTRAEVDGLLTATLPVDQVEGLRALAKIRTALGA